MGGMAAQVPIKDDLVANECALDKVKQDKLREVAAGHDGTWVAHPGLVSLARTIFDQHMSDPNQIHRKREDVEVTAADLLDVPSGTITESGLRHNISVGIRYLRAWLAGNGCVPIDNLMEDAATAEISRSQVWQWVAHGACLEGGEVVTAQRVRDTIAEEARLLLDDDGTDLGRKHVTAAATLFEQMMTDPELADWLTVAAYERLD